MLKPYAMPTDLLKQRPDDKNFRRWAHCAESLRVKDVVKSSCSVAFLGYADDSGVKKNLGRAGAGEAPPALRKIFYKLPALRAMKIADFGDLIARSQLKDSHTEGRETLSLLRKKFPLVVTFGGGHDWAAVDFDVKDAQIIHVDTHLDVRPFEPGNAHSGMPFRYLVEERAAKIWCIGAQPEHNSPEHWAYAQSHFQGLWSLDDCEKDFASVLKKVLSQIEPGKPLGLSLDLDGFAQSVSPGVSAPSARGVSIADVVAIIDSIAIDVSHFGIYELNPKFDRDSQSARLAAYLLSRFLSMRKE